MFKWCRISVLLCLLAAIVLLLFLNHVGLPDGLNRRIEEQFRAKGWELKYSRLRLRWYRGVVAEDLQLQRTNTQDGPHLFLGSAEFRLNWQAFRHFDLQANAVQLHNGRLRWLIPGTNQPQRTFAVDQLGGELLFHRDDFWELKYLEGVVLGSHIRVRGDVTNASLIREWKIPESPAEPRAVPGAFWHRFLTEAERVRFVGRPELQLMFSGDARQWKSFEAQLRFAGEGLESPWISGTNLSLTAHLLPSPRTNDALRADLRLTADQARSPWGSASTLDLTLVVEPSLTHPQPTNILALLELRGATSRWCRAERVVMEVRSSPSTTNNALNLTHLDVSVDEVQTASLGAAEARITATSLHPATQLLPAAVDALCTARVATTPWATSQWAQVRALAELPAATGLHLTDTGRPWPERLTGLSGEVRGSFSNLLAPTALARRSDLTVRWLSPRLECSASADIGDGGGRVDIGLDTATRELNFQGQLRLFPTRLAPFLTTNARPWLELVQFRAPPRFELNGRVTLPAWTNRAPDWAGEVWPTVAAAGQIESGTGQWRGVPFLAAHIPLTLTNELVTVPGLILTREEGALQLTGAADARTGGFHGLVQSRLDPLALRPAFPDPAARRVFDFFTAQTPPDVQASLRGNYRDWSQLAAEGTVALTNTTFRGQEIKAGTTTIHYTNQLLSILHPRVWREGEEGHADGIGIDLKTRHLHLTNAVARISVRAVTKCIGPMTDRTVAPYVFDLPPMARAEGTVPLGYSDGSEDMRFEIEGGPFHWQRFNLERIRALLHWRGDTLSITNVSGLWHGAEMKGWAHFDFTPKDTDRFQFLLQIDRADLRKVLRDLQPGRTNKVEGIVRGELRITRADTHNWQSWQGYGHVQMTNGLLWDIPLFTVFSPILNAFVPGLGNSRARHASATYQITNSVIHSQDLVIRATALHMNYRGSVDFEQRLDGRMDAELLRDFPGLGPLFSKLLWPVTKLFEYKVSGSLDHPNIEEHYLISRILMMPLHPFKTLKDLINLEDTRPDPPAP